MLSFKRRLVALALALAAGTAMTHQAVAEERVSSFGEYDRYAQPEFDGYVRSSHYVEAEDGTRLAVDVYQPANAGKVASGPFPVVWAFTPYQRASRLPDGTLQNAMGQIQLSLVRYGYVVAVADVRGKGASFGTRAGPSDTKETSDARDITDWLGTQSWSTGNVGMMGCSYLGSTTLQGARSGSPYLKAIFVGATWDFYESFGRGGIVARGLADDADGASRTVGVDEDADGSLLKQAQAQHKNNTSTAEFFKSTPFRDDINPFTGTQWWVDGSFYSHAEGVPESMGIYAYSGLFDIFQDQMVLLHRNMPNPRKIAFGPWHHCDSPGFQLEVERLRFFDYWLKGMENGVMEEPPVHLYMQNADNGTEWRGLPDWPEPNVLSRYYLDSSPPPPGPTHRVYDAPFISGSLVANAPLAGGSNVLLPSELLGRQTNVYYGRTRSNVDQYSATFTLPPQTLARELVGSPRIKLWVASTAADADIYVYLEHIHRSGGVEVISDGVIRASHRKTGTPPFDNGGLPWQTHRRADHQPLKPGEPVEIDLALQPTAWAIQPGDRLRLAVTTLPPGTGKAETPPPALTIFTGGEYPSYVELPDTDTRAHALKPRTTLGERRLVGSEK